MEAEVMPLPSPEATPPVTKTYFDREVTTGFHVNRGPLGVNPFRYAELEDSGRRSCSGRRPRSSSHRRGGAARIRLVRVTVSASTWSATTTAMAIAAPTVDSLRNRPAPATKPTT